MSYPAPGSGFDDAKLYRSLFHFAGVGIGIVDVRTGQFVRVNEKLCEILGYKEKQLIGRTVEELTHPDDHDRNLTEIDRLMRGDFSTMCLQKRYIRGDGTTFWALVHGTLLPSQTDAPTHSIAIVRDISSEKAAEQALQQSQERLRLIAESVEAVIWLCTPGAQEVLYVSPAYEQIWGRSCTGLYEDPHSFADTVHPEDRAGVLANLGKHERGIWEHEYRIIRPDGSVRWIYDRGCTLYDHAGEVTGLTGIAVDITDRKSTELQLTETVRALHQNTKELERMNRDLQQFASTVSHDLKAPLRAISGRVGMLSEDLGSNVAAEVQEHLSKLQDRVRDMEGMITGLLQYSRSSQKRSARELNVRDLVLQQIESMDVPAGFTVEVADDLPVITADPLQLGQVFANLIDNGIRHHDSANGLIAVNARIVEGHFEFIVTDDGPGIPEEERQRVFEMFESGRHHGDGSTGIGLALVKKLVEENGGNIHLTSGSRGSTFTFTWPLNAPL
jgi:PAS domain S-box-containing protein